MAPDAYDPPAALEGPNTGLLEAVAARIWAKRASLFSQRVTPADFPNQSDQVRVSWRATARDVLTMLLTDLGFRGPAGPPQILDTGWSYAWHADIGNWEIIDQDGGGVALVMHNHDVEMLARAPLMAQRIRELVAAVDGTGAADLPQIVALRESLPSPPMKPALEAQTKKEAAP